MAIAKHKVFECPIERSIAAIGARWKPRIIWSLKTGNKRFSDLRLAIPNISDRMLQFHLNELLEDGIVQRTNDSEKGWGLTQRGRELESALLALFDWGMKDTAL